jgi:hypothetical protein
MNASLRLGWRTLWRDLRAGELRLLIVAVLLAVAALTAVGFFADRLQGGLKRDARQLLGGDAVIVSDNPTPEAFVAQARSLGLQGTSTYGFPTACRLPPPSTALAPSRATFRPRAKPGSTPRCSTRWRSRSATRCCWATPACASAASSRWSPTAAPAS